MTRNNSRTLLVKAASFLGVASLSVLIGLPGFSQQSPGDTNPNVPSTVKPTNPGGRDAGTTNGGEDLNRVPSAAQNSMTGQPSGTPNNADPSSQPATINRVEGRDQGTSGTSERTPSSNSTMQQNNTTGQPSGTPENSDPSSNPAPVNRVEGSGQGTGGTQSGTYSQPGTTTGGDSSQQVEQNQNNGSTMQQNRTMPQGGSRQSAPKPRTQSDTNSGSSPDNSTSQQQPSNGGVRALW